MHEEENNRFIETAKRQERVVLAAVSAGEADDTEALLAELGELVRTAGGIVVGTVIQNREKVHPGTYFGKGKIEELALFMAEQNADTLVCDDELSPAQYHNLTDILSVKVLDRTMLILDIFAARARTAEGKIQVELAQLKYRSARLKGLGKSLSRLGGGIGTRGPGEKKLEIDRRSINHRVAVLREELSDVQRHRELLRTRRINSKTRTAAIVGYTNAGKSTLLNTLTDAGVLAENALFATLDPTTRTLVLPDGCEIMLTDTVGFIRKLPHQLIDAFKSTLEEVVYADLILHVADASNLDVAAQMDTVYKTLSELGAGDKTVYTLFNKMDAVDPQSAPDGHHLMDLRAAKVIRMSALYGDGLDDLMVALEEYVHDDMKAYEGTIPYDKAGLLAMIREEGTLKTEDYREDGIYVEAMLPRSVYGRLKEKYGV